MSKNQTLPDKLQVWIKAKHKYHLTDIQIQMARELGLNPLKFGKLANEKQEPWKKPLSEFICLEALGALLDVFIPQIDRNDWQFSGAVVAKTHPRSHSCWL